MCSPGNSSVGGGFSVAMVKTVGPIKAKPGGKTLGHQDLPVERIKLVLLGHLSYILKKVVKKPTWPLPNLFGFWFGSTVSPSLYAFDCMTLTTKPSASRTVR